MLAYGNLRGLREAGRAFALPTYFFVVMGGLVVVVGVLREVFGDLPQYAVDVSGPVPDHTTSTKRSSPAAAIFVLLKAFANGGSSLTGLEAISNGVSAFKRPEGRNARRTLSTMSLMLGSLVLGISFLAWQTHATPYENGSPTVISQVARAAFGHAWYGNTGWILVQVATALILITGANTPFTGFPYLASFIAEDAFLPRQLMRRGHRLAFSNGIIILTVAALALLLGVGANVNSLVPFYAIGVFTGFTMAGLGMARYHHTHREPGWRRRLVINLAGGRGVGAGRADLRRGEVHRGRLAGRAAVPARLAAADAPQSAVPARGALARPGHGRPRRRPAADALRPPRRAGVRRSPRPGRAAQRALRRQPAADRDPGRPRDARQRRDARTRAGLDRARAR